MQVLAAYLNSIQITDHWCDRCCFTPDPVLISAIEGARYSCVIILRGSPGFVRSDETPACRGRRLRLRPVWLWGQAAPPSLSLGRHAHGLAGDGVLEIVMLRSGVGEPTLAPRERGSFNGVRQDHAAPDRLRYCRLYLSDGTSGPPQHDKFVIFCRGFIASVPLKLVSC